jgi:hypothetical protein
MAVAAWLTSASALPFADSQLPVCQTDQHHADHLVLTDQ